MKGWLADNELETVKESDCGLIWGTTQHMPEWIEENHEKPQSE